MRTLVTGATGLIGTHLVQALVDRGHEVRARVRKTSRRDALSALPVTCVVADILADGADLGAACAGCDTVFHTAAQFTYAGYSHDVLHHTAVNGTANILEACAQTGVRRVVVTSSSVAYGYSDEAVVLDESGGLVDATEPAYVAAKIAQHHRAVELARVLNLDVLFACPTMTFGPTTSRLGPSNGLVVGYLADPFGCTFPGGCNIVSARDVAFGHLLIAERGRSGDSYLLGSENLTWQAVHRTIAELAGVAAPRFELNLALSYLAAAAEELRAALAGRMPLSTREEATMVGRYYWYSHAKANALGYAPQPARCALIETISWLAASPHISREIRAGMHLAPDIYRFRAEHAHQARA